MVFFFDGKIVFGKGFVFCRAIFLFGQGFFDAFLFSDHGFEYILDGLDLFVDGVNLDIGFLGVGFEF